LSDNRLELEQPIKPTGSRNKMSTRNEEKAERIFNHAVAVFALELEDRKKQPEEMRIFGEMHNLLYKWAGQILVNSGNYGDNIHEVYDCVYAHAQRQNENNV